MNNELMDIEEDNQKQQWNECSDWLFPCEEDEHRFFDNKERADDMNHELKNFW